MEIAQGMLKNRCNYCNTYTAPIGAFIVFLKFVRSRVLGVRSLRQSLVAIKYYLHPKMTVNGR